MEEIELLSEIKSHFKSYSKNALIRLIYDLNLASHRLNEVLNILETDNNSLAAMNDVFLAIIENNNLTEKIPMEALEQYKKTRQAGLNATIEIERQGMVNNAELAKSEVERGTSIKNSKNAANDRKKKPTKSELEEFERKYLDNRLKDGYESSRGWKKKACNEYKIDLKTLNDILNKKYFRE